MTKKQLKEQLRTLKCVRGIERERHFANSGTLHEWRGGLHTVTVNRKKQRDRRDCRGGQRKWLR